MAAMPKVKEDGHRPKKQELYEISLSQEGYFTLAQANQAGYSRQLLHYLLQKGEIERARRGIYRWVYFPLSEEGELIELWLWSEKNGVFSHHTALFLHRLSDALPAKLHMTVPKDWSRKRLQLPEHLVLHYDQLQDEETSWFGAIKTTKPLRTLLDCLESQLDPLLARQAYEEGLARGLFSTKQLEAATAHRGLSLLSLQS